MSTVKSHQDTCAIVQAQDAETSIRHVVSQLIRSGVGSCVIVLNGCSDKTAAAADSALKSFSENGKIISVAESLGHDVGKAVGTYYALRTPCIDARWFVYVDGDWKGGFGPDLERFISTAKQTEADVMFVAGQPSTAAPERVPAREDLHLWREALRSLHPGLRDISISESPLVIHRRVFLSIAPYWLYHPGLWSAYCVLQYPALRLHVSHEWRREFTGNPVRTGAHQQKMVETLIGDTLEGIAVIKGLEPHRRWKGKDWVGYHSSRRTDLLQSYMNTVTASL